MPRQPALLALATVSGAVALLYEVVFFRALGLAFGVSVHAVAAVVGAFLGGLGLGAALGGRWLTRGSPLAIYARLEFAIGAYGYAAPFLFRWLSARAVAGDIPELNLGSLPLGTLLAATAVLLPPTALMGATFPVLGRAIAAGATDVATPIGALYGLNTLGAFLGAACGAFWILPALGMTGSCHLAAGGNVVLGVLALALAARTRSETSDLAARGELVETAGAATVPSRGLAAMTLAVALIGMSSIALQVLGTRLLITLLGGSVYAFAAVLAMFLAGIGVGGAFGGRWIAGVRRPMTALAGCAVAMAGAIGAGLVLLRWKVGPEDPLAGALNLHIDLPPDVSVWPYVRIAFTLSALAFLPATLASGAFLPAATRFLNNTSADLSRGLGRLYAFNTLGAIVGSVAAGFFWLPWLKLRGALALTAAVAAAAALPLWWAARRSGEPRSGATVAAVATAAIALIVAGLRTSEAPGSTGDFPHDIIFHAESEASAVTVIEFPDGNEEQLVRSLAVNGKVVASSLFVDRRLQLLLGFIPTLIHPDPERILSIALGTGMSSGALAVSGAESVEIVELSQGVIDACYLFDQWNGHVDQRDNVTIHNDDGRRFVTRSDERYDLISADPIHPWVAGSAYLYTVEYYRIARDHLRDGGMMTQWIPLYQLTTEDIAGIVRSFREVFDHVSAWVTGYDMVLLGSTAPLVVDPALVRSRMQRQPVRGMLADIGVYDVADLLGCYFAGGETLADLATRAPQPITDDRPWIEFSAPRSLFGYYASEVFHILADSDAELTLVDGASEQTRDDVRGASRWLRAGARKFVDDIAADRRISESRAEYSDQLRVGYRRDDS